MQSEDNRNMLTLKLTQEFGGFLKGLTMSVQAMTEHIGYFSEYRRIWPDLYRATGRTAQGVLIKRCAQHNQVWHTEVAKTLTGNTIWRRKPTGTGRSETIPLARCSNTI